MEGNYFNLFQVNISRWDNVRDRWTNKGKCVVFQPISSWHRKPTEVLLRVSMSFICCWRIGHSQTVSDTLEGTTINIRVFWSFLPSTETKEKWQEMKGGSVVMTFNKGPCQRVVIGGQHGYKYHRLLQIESLNSYKEMSVYFESQKLYFLSNTVGLSTD